MHYLKFSNHDLRNTHTRVWSHYSSQCGNSMLLMFSLTIEKLWVKIHWVRQYLVNVVLFLIEDFKDLNWLETSELTWTSDPWTFVDIVYFHSVNGASSASHLLIPVITLHLLIVEKKPFYYNDHKITEFGITDKNSSTAYIVLYKWIDTWFLDSNRRVGVWSLPWRWHILSIPLTTGRGTSAETCGLDDVFPPDDLGSRPEALC